MDKTPIWQLYWAKLSKHLKKILKKFKLLFIEKLCAHVWKSHRCLAQRGKSTNHCILGKLHVKWNGYFKICKLCKNMFVGNDLYIRYMAENASATLSELRKGLNK